ncbi:MAG: (deoxy)nucleoside triphosphate pyrophosphohydrolase [Nitrospirae bacterium]|nr:(deoxy)nucleoside triphosphate pyrophosphohydrolase [Candidatus Manganitrophaceae bacterium]
MIDVAIGVILREGQVLITRRKEGVHLAGLWEFPGGKRDGEETIETCLFREIEEELGARIAIERLLWTKRHPYPDRTVILHAFLCRPLSDDLKPLAAQELRWVSPETLLSLPFPEANRPLLEALAAELTGESP